MDSSTSHAEPGRDHFSFSEYVSQGRWSSYWHQVNEVLRSEPMRCLIVGVGDGMMAHILRSSGVEVTSCDIVADLAPDVMADVRSLPFADADFEVALCCEVLEHIPYETVGLALGELARVASKRIIISVPNNSRTLTVGARVGSHRRYWSAQFRVMPRRTWVYDNVHHWEIGTKNYTERGFKRLLSEHFKIEASYRVRAFPFHHFYVLRPIV